MPSDRPPIPTPHATWSSGETASRKSSFGSDYSDKGKVKPTLTRSIKSFFNFSSQEMPRSMSDNWVGETPKSSDTRSSYNRTPSSPSSARSFSNPKSPTVNVYTHCGRHSNQWIFGGRSVSDMVRNAIKRD